MQKKIYIYRYTYNYRKKINVNKIVDAVKPSTVLGFPRPGFVSYTPFIFIRPSFAACS